MPRLRWLPFALLALSCTPRAGTSGGGFFDPDAGADVPAAQDILAPTDNPATPTDSPATPTDNPAPPTDNPATPTDACVPRGAENAPGACADRVDNDCNGFFDCADPACASVCQPVDAGCVRTGNEDDNAQCGDGRDNDCDGFTDCVDFSCRMNPAVTLCAVDAGCVPFPENSNGACTDGRDNDCDGFLDCNDFDCSRATSVTVCPRDAGIDTGACLPSPENTNGACTDGRDNDCDGFLDCNDFDCTFGVGVTVCPRDGGAPRDVTYRDVMRADAAGCIRSGDENTPTACTDGRDNDCDGFLDCDDRNCSCVGTCPGAILGCACSGGVENSNGVCRNGVDDDCNGFIDCNDFGCSRNPAVTVCADGGL